MTSSFIFLSRLEFEIPFYLLNFLVRIHMRLLSNSTDGSTWGTAYPMFGPQTMSTVVPLSAAQQALPSRFLRVQVTTPWSQT